MQPGNSPRRHHVTTAVTLRDTGRMETFSNTPVLSRLWIRVDATHFTI
ncbi:MAG: hypothetical protein IJ721_01675 [Bacteroidales bacterium]|nr:hypothetical protein [Bacteroidales bacterium]